MKTYFVTGIGTDVGKTVVAAIITQALNADYWKPIQSGDLNNTDSIKIKQLTGNKNLIVYPETYQLTQPLSPHIAANLDGIKINLSKISLPKTSNNLVIEGAGGVMVPLNNSTLMIDLIKKLNANVIVVSKNYLGSINHTLLTIQALKHHKIPIAGIVFNGNINKSTEEIILKFSKLKCLFRLNNEKKITPIVIKKYATIAKKVL